jgi:hypothetical protein
MSWIYGGIFGCKTLGDWVYGDILSCTTLPGATYPTEALSRVTSLVHRWRPGMYTLTVGLGEVTSELILRDIMPRIGARPTGDVAPPDGDTIPPGPELIPGPCVIGERTCFGFHLYECVPMPTTDPEVYPDSAWVLTEPWSASCITY